LQEANKWAHTTQYGKRESFTVRGWHRWWNEVRLEGVSLMIIACCERTGGEQYYDCSLQVKRCVLIKSSSFFQFVIQSLGFFFVICVFHVFFDFPLISLLIFLWLSLLYRFNEKKDSYTWFKYPMLVFSFFIVLLFRLGVCFILYFISFILEWYISVLLCVGLCCSFFTYAWQQVDLIWNLSCYMLEGLKLIKVTTH
jgi:hypothetical protein